MENSTLTISVAGFGDALKVIIPFTSSSTPPASLPSPLSVISIVGWAIALVWRIRVASYFCFATGANSIWIVFSWSTPIVIGNTKSSGYLKELSELLSNAIELIFTLSAVLFLIIKSNVPFLVKSILTNQ